MYSGSTQRIPQKQIQTKYRDCINGILDKTPDGNKIPLLRSEVLFPCQPN